MVRVLSALVVLGALDGCAKHLPPTLVPSEALVYQTDDGWTGEIRHYPGDGPVVLLVHGMGANHYNWDYREEVSLSHTLQQQGYDVWIPELRGDPGSWAPSKEQSWQFDFDDHAQHDLPAIVDAVLAQTGDEQLLWVGHSMGGMLLYTALSQYPEKIRAGVTICSPSTFETQLKAHHTLNRLDWAIPKKGKVPAAGLAKATAGMGRANPAFGRIANKKNLDWTVARGLARHALVDLPLPMAHQAATWMQERALTTVDGQPWVQPDPTPLLVLGAPLDKVVAEADVAATCDTYPNCTYVRLAKEDGFSADYGHIDPVLGVEAPAEVYPLVVDFLDAHSGGQAEVGMAPSE